VLPGEVALDDVGQVEEDPLSARRRIDNGSQEVSAAAANICDRVEAAEVVGAEDRGDVGVGLGRHRLPEDLRLGRATVEVGPDAARLNGLHGWCCGADGMFEVPECLGDDA
jgi:hypothetical protein